MHYGFSVLFVVTFSSPHFIPLIDIGVEIGAKREKMAEKQQKIFLTLDFDNSNLSNQGCFVFCCFFCSLPFVGHCPKRVLSESACRFLSTNGLFYWKHRVVLLETTCCFVGNNVLFCWKGRVVLLKTTYRFIETDVSFSIKGEKPRNPSLWNRNRKGNIGIVKIPIPPLSRARTRTLLSRVFAFLLSQVSQEMW